MSDGLCNQNENPPSESGGNSVYVTWLYKNHLCVFKDLLNENAYIKMYKLYMFTWCVLWTTINKVHKVVDSNTYAPVSKNVY